MSNSTMNDHPLQEKTICIAEVERSREIYNLLIKNDIPKKAISLENTNNEVTGIYVKSEYLPQADELSRLYDFIYWQFPHSFDQIRRSHMESYLKERKGALEEAHSDLIKEYMELCKRVPKIEPQKMNTSSTLDIFSEVKENIQETLGSDLIGLRTSSIPELNDKLRGLRGLLLLGAGPGVGKTTLSLQLAVEALLEKDNDACALFITLEMDKRIIVERIYGYLAGLEYNVIRFGHKGIDGYRTNAERDALNKAELIMATIAPNMQLIHAEDGPINHDTIIKAVEDLKEQTGKSRCFIVIDYLQLWPVDTDKPMQELQEDKIRIAQISKISRTFPKDPCIAICELKKPKTPQEEPSMNDILGSARIIYSADVIFLLNALSNYELANLASQNGITLVQGQKASFGEKVRNEIKKHNKTLCYLVCEKARDGMEQFKTLLEFNYKKSTFKPGDCYHLGETIRFVGESFKKPNKKLDK